MARIMIVDDESDLLLLYSEMISLFGHDIVAAVSNGEEALRKYDEISPKPDLIILDHRMPIRNGLETAEEILSRDSNEKIIFISADSTIKDQALDIGVLYFIEKPFMLNTLKTIIQKVLKE